MYRDPEHERHVRKARSSRPWANMVAKVLRHKGTICHLCGQDGATSGDHIIPVSHGGMTTFDNVAPVHHACNIRRQDKPVAQYEAELAGATLPTAGARHQLNDGTGRWIDHKGHVTSRDW